MSALNSDKFKKLTNNFSTTLSGAIVGAGDTSMSLTSATNLPTDTGTVFVIDRVDASGTATPTTREYVKGVVSGTSVTNLVRGLGGSTAQAHSTGAVVEQVVDQTTINDLMDGILVEHNQDGTHGDVTATSITSSGGVTGTTLTGSSLVNTGDVQLRSISLETIASERFFDHVASGCVWTADSAGSTLNGSMTSGVVYIGGARLAVSAVTAHGFTASKDTYVDVDNTGTLHYTEVSNNAASPALSTGYLRLAIVVTGSSSIAASTSINQGQENRVLPIASSIPYAVTDSLGNLICPRDPNRKILGYRQITSDFSLTSSQTTITQVTGLSVPVVVPTGRKIRISVSGECISVATGGDQVNPSIWDGAVNSGTKLTEMIATASNFTNPSFYIVTTPSTASKIYNVGLRNGTAARNVSFNATSSNPSFIAVELV